MTKDDFWRLVAASRATFDPKLRDGNMDRQLTRLRELLSDLPSSSVGAFDEILENVVDRAYSWDLWGAAYVIAGGCSDDWFDYFRYWLVSMGREVYEAALSDADSLATVARQPGVEDVFFEEFAYVAGEVLESRGESLVRRNQSSAPGEPVGKKWTTEQLPTRFPKLWSAFGAG